MSRRFGRQQKRKLTARVEGLEKECARLEREVALLRWSYRANQQAVLNTARVLGEYFCSLGPKVLALDSLQRMGDTWQHISRQPDFRMEESAAPFVERALVEVQHLPVLKCRAVLDELRGAVHYRFVFNGKEAGYAISQAAIMQQPGFKEAAKRNVAEAVARLFMDTEAPRQGGQA
jgi:hypothetical protein